MSWWAIPVMLTADVYAACFTILAWAIRTAPLVPDSEIW